MRPRRSLHGTADGTTAVAELGTVTRTLLGIVRDGVDDHALAQRICEACVDGLDIDGAGISLLTASSSRETLWSTDATADLLEEEPDPVLRTLMVC